MLFIRPHSCIPLMTFWVNCSKAFDAHAHMKTKKSGINFALQQTCLAELIASVEMHVLLSIELWCLNYNTKIHSIAVVQTVNGDRCSPWQTLQDMLLQSCSCIVAYFFLPTIKHLILSVLHTVSWVEQSSLQLASLLKTGNWKSSIFSFHGFFTIEKEH